MSRARVSGVGSYVPENILTNSELEKIVDTSDDWIVERTGISERRIASPDQATSDLAFFAAAEAIGDAGLQASDIDLIIVATETPDHPFPPVACQLQHRLGCRSIAAFDVHLACTGFIAALHVAEKFIKSGSCRHALVVGAGAFVLSAGDEASPDGIIHSAIHSNGEYFDAAIVPGGGSRHPQPHSEETKYKILMNGNRIFRLAVTLMSQSIKETLEHSGLTLDQVDWVIPHQANQRIIDAVGRTLDVPHEKMISTIRYYGNNSAATIPLAMDHSVKTGKIKRGDMVAMAAFGGGLGWGSALLKY
ncbi:ketoacyl-ACP synthase III [Paenibacillus naphthalenovorans]|uniref:beta-ketoacyl-ACP synthase III n=1 Tax=Paenibacillus naphthalenovorans TaxID=162209 RepID=UPI0010B7896D|nr:beta-ketoacyl-ACP synthase III [Paenibacillus naphthalenovorans]GCL73514.1 ketoacyl-ACP synthase III [Paenibacillus naphthalenovorans]